MSDISKVIARILHLRKLAENNTNLHEAQAATRAADKLIQEYRLSQAELEQQGNAPQDPMTDRIVHKGGRRTAWREKLMWALTTHYGCSWYMSGGRGNLSYKVIGRESDIQILSYMFAWLTEEIERLCKTHSRGMGVAYARSWLDGAAQGVRDTFIERKREMQAQAGASAAMVLLDRRGKEAEDHKITMYPNLRKAGSVNGGRRSDGRSDGYQVGKQIRIQEGLGAGKSSDLLSQ